MPLNKQELPDQQTVPQPLNNAERAFIRQGMMFSSMDDDQFDTVAALSRVVTIEKDNMLFMQNQAAHHFFVLMHGQIKLTRTSFDGNEKVIDVIHAAQSFAEAVILSQYDVFPVNAQAIEDSRVIAIQANTYLNLLKQSAELCLGVMARMGQRMHWLINEIDRLVLHNATYRLISYLLEQVGPDSKNRTEFRLNTPKMVIASRLSIAPETLSRTLKKLTLNKLIDYQRDGTIVLRNLPELQRLITLELGENSAVEHDALGKCPRL